MSSDPVQVTMKSQSPDDVLVYFADEHVTTGLPLTRISPGVVRIDAVPFVSRAHAEPTGLLCELCKRVVRSTLVVVHVAPKRKADRRYRQAPADR